MRRKFPQLTYANVMSTLAVFIALGGSSYAAVTISGSSLKGRSVSGAKLKRNTITGLEVRESSLFRVPRASLADRLGAAATQQLTQRCPADTVAAAGTCVEIRPRGTAPYSSAVATCSDLARGPSPRRRIPTHNELKAALSYQVVEFADPELTSNVFPSSTTPGRLDVLVLTQRVGTVGLTTDIAEGAKNFRCAVDPSNQGEGGS